jgi:hypothetical protein
LTYFDPPKAPKALWALNDFDRREYEALKKWIRENYQLLIGDNTKQFKKAN